MAEVFAPPGSACRSYVSAMHFEGSLASLELPFSLCTSHGKHERKYRNVLDVCKSKKKNCCYGFVVFYRHGIQGFSGKL
ncbi:hypothetical protein WN55_10830 [Dufourea novaeangliae]|uniref:Uncharacterized protein n=1 Tax=Dufourea novaeangliae TaxID=178035 RepID=A0A154P9J3_DUFNO|nr:hypothetical protein WN55_10830 [Dufourea novaeangliae]